MDGHFHACINSLQHTQIFVNGWGKTTSNQGVGNVCELVNLVVRPHGYQYTFRVTKYTVTLHVAQFPLCINNLGHAEMTRPRVSKSRLRLGPPISTSLLGRPQSNTDDGRFPIRQARTPWEKAVKDSSREPSPHQDVLGWHEGSLHQSLNQSSWWE